MFRLHSVALEFTPPPPPSGLLQSSKLSTDWLSQSQRSLLPELINQLNIQEDYYWNLQHYITSSSPLKKTVSTVEEPLFCLVNEVVSDRKSRIVLLILYNMICLKYAFNVLAVYLL